jgi:hypothetical protein
LGSLAENLRRSARQFKVPEKEQQELAALLVPLEKDVVDK